MSLLESLHCVGPVREPIAGIYRSGGYTIVTVSTSYQATGRGDIEGMRHEGSQSLIKTLSRQRCVQLWWVLSSRNAVRKG